MGRASCINLQLPVARDTTRDTTRRMHDDGTSMAYVSMALKLSAASFAFALPLSLAMAGSARLVTSTIASQWQCSTPAAWMCHHLCHHRLRHMCHQPRLRPLVRRTLRAPPLKPLQRPNVGSARRNKANILTKEAARWPQGGRRLDADF